jgi:transcriptional regulator with XRE-family HTH domain
MAAEMTLRIGHAVSICRAAKGWSMATLANNADLTPSMLSLVEDGKRELSVDALERVTKALEIPMPHFLLLASDEQTVAEAPDTMCVGVLRWLLAA